MLKRLSIILLITITIAFGVVTPQVVESMGTDGNGPTTATKAGSAERAGTPARKSGGGFKGIFKAIGKLFGGESGNKSQSTSRQDSNLKPAKATNSVAAAKPLTSPATPPVARSYVQPTATPSHLNPAEADTASRMRQPVDLPRGEWTPFVKGVPLDHLSQGRALLERGFINEAIAELSIAATIGPSLIEANNLLGLAFDRKGHHEDAIICYERVLRAEPHSAETLNNMGLSLYASGDREGALKRLKSAARYAPSDLAILGNLAVVECALGKYDGAVKLLRRVEDEFSARVDVARMIESVGRGPEAIKYYEAALRQQPKSRFVLERLAELYKRAGRTEDAQTILNILHNLANGVVASANN